MKTINEMTKKEFEEIPIKEDIEDIEFDSLIILPTNYNHNSGYKCMDFIACEKEKPLLDEDIKKVLAITDNLLGKLPEEIIDEFIKSKDYELYEKVIRRYKIK